MKLRVLLNSVLPPLREWERRLLDEVEHALPDSLRAAFSEQIREINYVQRHQRGKEINFYRMKGGEANASTAPKISTPTEEYLLARVQVEASVPGTITCQLWIVCGIVFSLTCDAPSQKIDASARIRVLDIFPPSLAPERNPLLDSINAELRNEYEQAVATGRMFGGGVQLLEPKKLRHLAVEGHNYCVLGESTEAELILARAEKPERGLFILNVEDGEIRRAANSLAELLSR